MINISFYDPYLLLLIIPLALLVIIPFFIAIRRENKSRGAVASLVCHLLIVTLTVLAAAGMMNTSVMTKTEVYVLADVSDSAAAKTDIIDDQIRELSGKLPINSEMGVIAFGKDAVLNTPLGGDFVSLRESEVDTSATDILQSLRFADSLFGDDAIKRIVLYTDGFSTDPESTGELIQEIEQMSVKGIYFDVVYVDSNIESEACEFQVSDVEFNSSTYLGHENSANILVESTVEANAVVRLSKNGEAYLEKAVKLTAGYNIVTFELSTDAEGEYDYTVSVHTEDDGSANNNKLHFTQTVNDTISILLVTDREEDVGIINELYGGYATIDSYVKPVSDGSFTSSGAPKPVSFDVPFTVEDLCKYDQYILSNVKVEDINNADTFIESIDICVSQFGKSLITAGDNGLQGTEATAAQSLANMLPIRFGNNDQEPKLYAIVIDSSRSMEFKNFDFFRMAKSAAKYMLGFLNENDYFTIVNFSGEAYVPIPPCQATEENIASAEAVIDALEVTQGTMIGRSLDRVCEMIMPYSFDDKQVMLISDGMSFEGGESLSDDPIASAIKLKENNITVSTLNAGNLEGINTMKMIAAAGGGNYYFAESSSDLVGVMFDKVKDDVTDTVVTGEHDVIIARPNDDVLKGVDSLPAIEGYVYARSKASAENILFAEYEKANGTVVNAPLYSYWNYGNGRVSTLTTSLGGDWTASWLEGYGAEFLQNINRTNIPKVKIDHPYTVDISFDGKYAHIEIIPAVLNPDATMTVTVKKPDGGTYTELLTFDSYRYFCEFEADTVGKYTIDTTYDLKTKSYSSSNVFNISYSPEYDRFNTYSPAMLHKIVRNNGNIYESGNAVIVNDPAKLETYVVYFTVPLLAAAAVLYIIDTVVRKLKWADIKSFFGKSSKKVKKEGKG